MNDDAITVNAIILAICTELDWRLIYACKLKEKKNIIK